MQPRASQGTVVPLECQDRDTVVTYDGVDVTPGFEVGAGELGDMVCLLGDQAFAPHRYYGTYRAGVFLDRFKF